MSFDDCDREVVSRGLVRERFEVSAATDACGLKPGARVFSLFDGEPMIARTGGRDHSGFRRLLWSRQGVHIVFDDGSDHRLWACDVARALPASIRATTLKVDRPNAKGARQEIDKLRRDPGAGRRRLETNVSTLRRSRHLSIRSGRDLRRPRSNPPRYVAAREFSRTSCGRAVSRRGPWITIRVAAPTCVRMSWTYRTTSATATRLSISPKCSHLLEAGKAPVGPFGPEGWSAEAKEANKVAEKLADILVSAKHARTPTF